MFSFQPIDFVLSILFWSQKQTPIPLYMYPPRPFPLTHLLPPIAHSLTTFPLLHTLRARTQASLSTDVQQRAYELVELSKNGATFAAAFPVDASAATGACMLFVWETSRQF